MTEPGSQHTHLSARLDEALTTSGSPLSVVPHDPAEMLDSEIGFHDARFDTPLILAAARVEALVSDRPLTDVTTGLENLSAAYVVADEVEEATSVTPFEVHAADVDFSAKALTQGVVSLHSVEDAMTVDVPLEAIALDPVQEMGHSAAAALTGEIDRITGTNMAERVGMATPIGRQLDAEASVAPASAFETGDPFDTGDPFTSPSADSAVETNTVADPVPAPEVQPGHEPGL